MHLKQLQLNYFRNFSEGSFEFGPNFNILVGDNAQGKTNVLEAIALLSYGKSFRTSEWRDLVQHDRGKGYVGARTVHASGEDELQVLLEEPRKRFLKNGKNTTPGGFQNVRVVLFAPEEILLLRTSPGARRRFIDSFVCSLVPSYKKTVRDYESVVSHRNRILSDEEKNDFQKRTLLEPWDEQLVTRGTKVILERKKWSEKLSEALTRHYGTIAKKDEEANFIYQPHVNADSFMETLSERRDDELRRHITLVGPHRDDLVAFIGEGQVKRFSSQGQHRSFVLALKIAETDIYEELTGEVPIFLLDDVASELDPERNSHFFEYLMSAKGQVFITTTRVKDVRLAPTSEAKSFVIEGGSARVKTP
jgi:DNA replication and repair protein RecF